MKLTLIRHTSLQIPSGICYGQSDIDVAASFDTELNTLAGKLKDTPFNAVYASPLQRCSKLALAINKGVPQHDNRLKELHFGDWEMQAWDDIPRDIFDAWANDYANLAPPNGESFTQLQQRGISILDEMLAKHRNESIAVITHGGMIRAYLAHVLNMPLKGLFRFNVDYASVTELDFNGAVPKINFVNR